MFISAPVEFRWSLQVGDPTISGWMITLAYLVAGFISIKTHRQKNEDEVEVQKVWLFLGIILICLGLNKQLDLQTIITDVGRWGATRLNLMEQRHLFKRVFILCLFISLVFFTYYLRIPLKMFMQKYRVVGFGCILIVTFVFCRALSFHIFSIPFNEFLAKYEVYIGWEIIALGIIFIGVWKYKQLIHSDPR